MWVVYFFISYLVLGLTIPICWSLVPLWRRARRSRRVSCPELSDGAVVQLDPWYAVRMHAVGNPELRVRDCSQWPHRCSCGQECLIEIGVRV
jgi:hypothetical protein